jgi:polysaccharide export outer membrane protein
MRQLLWIVLAVGLATAGAAQDYVIQPGDRLEISVLEDPGLNREVLVQPDGKISLPLAGVIDVADRTPAAVQATLRRLLARDFVEPPTVTVALAALADGAAPDGSLSSIYVIGEVRAPGRYDVELPLDALQALAIAGGPDVFAARSRIQIRRRGAEGETVQIFDYDLVEEGATPSASIGLREGDVIVVPTRRLFE